MKRRNSIITLLLTLSMVFSTSAFAVFADTTDQEEQIVKDAPATEEVVNEVPEEPAAAPEQPAVVPEQRTEAVEPAGELKPAEEPTAETKEGKYIEISYSTTDWHNFSPEVQSDSGNGWSYVGGDTRTLTLTNFSGRSISFGGTDLNIVLQDNNTVSGGIWSWSEDDDKLVISGSGSLTIGHGWNGISADSVTINGGTITINDVGEEGIYAYNGDVTINGGTVTIKGTGNSGGIYANRNVSISGGNVKISANDALSAGKMISFSGDTYVDVESIKPNDQSPQEADYQIPAVHSFEKNAITLSDDLQIVLPENAKFASYSGGYSSFGSVNVNRTEGTMIAEPNGNPAKHVIIDRVKNPSGMLLAKAVAKGKTNMAISWTAMNDVDGYDVFFARCNTKSKKFAPELVASVDKGTTSYTVSGLKKGTAYKAYVQAYIMKSGAKQYVGKSLSTHAYAGGSSKKYTNPKSVKVKKAKVSIKKGKTYKINASVRKLKKSKKLISAEHAKKLRYLSSNTSIATVSKKGKIKAVTPGTCTVYAIAANGARKAVSVTVK